MHSPDVAVTDFVQEDRRSLHTRTRRQMKRTGASPYVSVSDLRRYIQRHMRFSARTVAKSPNSGAQPRRGRDGFRSQEGHRSLHTRTRRQMKRTGASPYVSVRDLRRYIQRHMRFSACAMLIKTLHSMTNGWSLSYYVHLSLSGG